MKNKGGGFTWRILIVEDKEHFVRQLKEVIPSSVSPPDDIVYEVCSKFSDAEEMLKEQRFDLLILDLKDDSDTTADGDENPAGLEVFEALKKMRFIPVVFYTALAPKVRSYETSFVRVVEKTQDVTVVRDEVARVFGTQLPTMIRQLEEVQRSYMWDFVTGHWKDFPMPSDQADIAYLMARRLAIALEAEAGGLAAQVGGVITVPAGETKAHPMIMYVVPPMGKHPMAGDILEEKVNGILTYWLTITPSCDFAQKKADHFTLAKCELLVDRPEYKKWIERKDEKSRNNLEGLIKDNKGERFKFLPRAFFLPDLVVDFQQLKTLGIDEFTKFKPVAALDSPFAESTAARFSRYFNRMGTPDVDANIVFGRLEAVLAAAGSAAIVAPPAEAPTAIVAPPAEAPTAIVAPPAEAPTAIVAPPAEVPTVIVAPPAEVPTVIVAPPVEVPTAIAAPATASDSSA